MALNDWPYPACIIPGWRLIGWHETMQDGDTWVHSKHKSLPNANPGFDRSQRVMECHWNCITPAMLFKNNEDGLSWQVYRKSDGYIPERRRLPMNPIFSRPLPLP